MQTQACAMAGRATAEPMQRKRAQRRVVRRSILALIFASSATVLICQAIHAVGKSLGFASAVRGSHRPIPATVRRVSGASDPKAFEQLVSDPEKMQQMQREMQNMMSNPASRKMIEKFTTNIQQGMDKLQSDPEMKDFFADIKKNGMAGMKKYEKDERIMRKLTEATGGMEGLQQLAPVLTGGAPVPNSKEKSAFNVPSAIRPGDRVFIIGLQARPELNEQIALVVPPTAEELETIKGSGRLIVRLLGTGEQFAVKPDNIQLESNHDQNSVGPSTNGGMAGLSAMLNDPAVQNEVAKLRDSGKLEALQNDPKLKPILDDIKKNGMDALQKYWNDEKLMADISKAMGVDGTGSE